MIVGILNQKGGVGKTTITINVGYALKEAGEKVLIVDSDPQGTARHWHNANGGVVMDVIGLDRPTLDKDVAKLALHYDWVLIDGVQGLLDKTSAELAAAAIRASDIVLIPVPPSQPDVWSTADFVGLVKRWQSVSGGKPKTAFLISKQIVGTVVSREANEIMAQFEFPVFEARTSQRIAYVNSVPEGKTVLHLSSADAKAAQAEIRAIAEELRRFSCVS